MMRPHTHRVKRDERTASLSFLLKQLVNIAGCFFYIYVVFRCNTDTFKQCIYSTM
nr:MAG TPA: hypothetical protein [Caudoviricetes sp.]